MTLITFQDGKPVLRDGKVGTEQECCCCEFSRITLSIFNAGGLNAEFGLQSETPFFDGLWETCYEGIFQTMKQRLESAGWTVTITTRTAEEPGYGLVTYATMTATGECDFNCQELYDAAVQGTPDISDQREGLWVELQKGEAPGEYFLCDGNPDLGFPMRIIGCCGIWDAIENQVFEPFGPGFYTPSTVNGDGDVIFSMWVPVCNPLP
jgi:hypothetical protein